MSFPKSARACTVINAQTGRVAKQSITSHVQQATPRVKITALDVADPHRLARALNDIQAYIHSSLSAVRTSTMSAGQSHFRNVSVTSGVAHLFTHNLGRPINGYFVTRVQGSSQVTLRETALPGGLTIDKAVNLIPSATGTIDVLIF